MTTVTVLRAGPLALVQDRGRPGYAHLGVPPSGALDLPALEQANRLVGNPPDAAGIEALLGGVALRADGPCLVAVTGAAARLRATRAGLGVSEAGLGVSGAGLGVSGAGSGSDEVGFATAVRLSAGDVLRVGTPSRGLRCYVAVSGGIAVPAELGSRSTDVLSGIGPAPLADGDELPLGGAAPGSGSSPPEAVAEPGPGSVSTWASTSAPTSASTFGAASGTASGATSGSATGPASESASESAPESDGPGNRHRRRAASDGPSRQTPGESALELPVLLGPRDDWFDDAAAQLTAAAWTVSPTGNRIGVWLTGATLRRASAVAGKELPTEPVVAGAIQVPPSGQPVIFLNDHPTTGGYPVIAVVHADALPLLAQARPGTPVHLRPDTDGHP